MNSVAREHRARRFFVFFTPFLFVMAIISNCGQKDRYSPPVQGDKQYRRIVSLSPSITEILFALGLGDKVVGVTRFCKYPPAALIKPKVGGYYDPNYEMIVRLNADLIIMLPEHAASKGNLASLGATILTVDHTTLAGTLGSIEEIGEKCGVPQRARELAGNIRARMEIVEKRTAALTRPRVMISLGRGMASGSLNDIFIAGQGTMYDELITLAGGVNVYKGKSGSFPQIALEGIYELNPEVVIDMVPDLAGVKLTSGEIRAEWNKADRVDAVKQGRIYLFEQDYVTIPGPRIILTLEQMARAIHPEVAWE
jgi:iron complex transport system substrate-binding protein